MSLNYAIFRSSPIYTLKDLAGIGSHNKREKKAYNSNPDINLELTKNNIELKELDTKYVKGFYEITKEYKKEHDERMKTEREDRKRTYSQMLDKSKNVVADELLFTATHEFFKDKNINDIKRWAGTCMNFVYQDLGYKKEQILHATVHMDEKTPHIHCVVIPLIKKYDKRTNTNRYTISKKQYIKDNIHLSQLQDKYYDRLNQAGFDLERGIKNNDTEHIKIKEYKKLTNKLTNQITQMEKEFDNTIKELTENMKSNKPIIFDKDSIKIKKETLDSINKVIKESKKINELTPKIKTTYENIKYYTDNYSKTHKENFRLTKEIRELQDRNNYLENKYYKVKNTIYNQKNIIDGMVKFTYDLVSKGLIPKTKQEEFEEQFSEFISGKNKYNYDVSI